MGAERGARLPARRILASCLVHVPPSRGGDRVGVARPRQSPVAKKTQLSIRAAWAFLALDKAMLHVHTLGENLPQSDSDWGRFVLTFVKRHNLC